MQEGLYIVSYIIEINIVQLLMSGGSSGGSTQIIPAQQP